MSFKPSFLNGYLYTYVYMKLRSNPSEVCQASGALALTQFLSTLPYPAQAQILERVLNWAGPVRADILEHWVPLLGAGLGNDPSPLLVQAAPAPTLPTQQATIILRDSPVIRLPGCERGGEQGTSEGESDRGR